MSKRKDITILQQKVQRLEDMIDQLRHQIDEMHHTPKAPFPYDPQPNTPVWEPTCSVCKIPYKNSYSYICGRPDCPPNATCIGSI